MSRTATAHTVTESFANAEFVAEMAALGFTVATVTEYRNVPTAFEATVSIIDAARSAR